jgi:hypothetical protein
MPPISGRLHSLLEQYIYLFLSYIFGRPAQDREDDGLNDGFTSVGSHTAHTNVIDQPHFSFRPTTSPLTTPIVNHRDLHPPRSCKRKALLVGVGSVETRRRGRRPVRPLNLRGPHRDVWNMRQLLIGGFKFSTSKNISDVYPPFLADRWHYDQDDIILLVNTSDPETVQPTRENIV